MLLHPPGSDIEHGPVDPCCSFVNDWIYFECDNGLINNMNLKINKTIKCQNPEIISGHISTINLEEIKKDAYSPEIISNTIYNMLLHFKRWADIFSGETAMVPQRLECTRNTILSNPQNKWTLKDMADLSGYSVSRFSKLYTEYYGTSPIDELIDIRIEKSKFLLRLKSYSVTEISEMCGFSSIHYFSKCFKARTGMSPKDFLFRLY